jgi:hypothetical protein
MVLCLRYFVDIVHGTMSTVLCAWYRVYGIYPLSGTLCMVLCLWYFVHGTVFTVLCAWYCVYGIYPSSGTLCMVLCLRYLPFVWYIYYYVLLCVDAPALCNVPLVKCHETLPQGHCFKINPYILFCCFKISAMCTFVLLHACVCNSDIIRLHLNSPSLT